MRQKFSSFFNPNLFHNQICERFYMRFIGRVLHNFTFYDNLRDFLKSTVCHATLIKSCKSHAMHSTCIPCHKKSH